jgi:hypothetical protein
MLASEHLKTTKIPCTLLCGAGVMPGYMRHFHIRERSLFTRYLPQKSTRFFCDSITCLQSRSIETASVLRRRVCHDLLLFKGFWFPRVLLTCRNGGTSSLLSGRLCRCHCQLVTVHVLNIDLIDTLLCVVLTMLAACASGLVAAVFASDPASGTFY